MELVVIGIVLLMLASMLIMVGINVVFEWAVAILPAVAVLIGVIGMIIGFCTALKNTCSVYSKIFVKKGV